MKTDIRRSGVTLPELLIVITIIGALTAMATPRIFDGVYKSNIRGARMAFANMAVRARAVAAQRGCITILHVTTGAAGTAWVTACKINMTGTDTVGRVEPLASRYSVSMSAALALLQFQPRGISVGYQPMTVVFTSSGGGYRDSTVINELGKVVH